MPAAGYSASRACSFGLTGALVPAARLCEPGTRLSGAGGPGAAAPGAGLGAAAPGAGSHLRDPAVGAGDWGMAAPE